MFERREFIGTAALALLAAHTPLIAAGEDMSEVFGLIGQMRAVPGKRAALLAILVEASAAMEGNLLYLVAEDLADPDAIWITEVWRSRADHDNSLKPAAVQAAIARARPLLAGFGLRVETRPINHVA